MNTKDVKYLKLTLFSIHTALTFFLGTLLCLIRPMHRNNTYTISRLLAFPAFKILGITIRTEGNLAVLKENKPVIFVANHQHNFDMILAAAIMKPNTVSVGKKSLAKVPIFGQFYILSGNILVDRSNPKKAIKALKEVAHKIIDKSISIWIFPEGRRNPERPMIPFKRGAFISAIEAQAPIVPVVIEPYANRTEFAEVNPFTIRIKVLDPIDTKNLNAEEQKNLHQLIYDRMEGALNAF